MMEGWMMNDTDEWRMNEEWWRMKNEWWRMMISSCWQTDEPTNRRRDICENRVAFATEKNNPNKSLLDKASAVDWYQ